MSESEVVDRQAAVPTQATMQASSRTTFYRRVIFLLGTLFLANPIILFLLTRSVIVACAITIACVSLMQIVAFRSGWNLLTAYLFNAITVLSIFAHAEVILLYGFPDYVVENLYSIRDGYYFNRPFLDQTFSAKEYVVRYRTNVQGFRIATEYDASQSIAAADWLVIGDSFTQGAQVEFSELYTTLLNERFPDKIILNAGISGLGLGHEYNYFSKEGYNLRPELVILQLSSFNDFMNVEPSLVGLSDRLMTHSAFVRLLLADFKFTNPAALPLGRWTEPFQTNRQSNSDFNIFFNESSPAKRRDLEAFERYLTGLQSSVKSHGAKLLVVLIPTKEQVYGRYLEEVLREFAIDHSELDMRRPNQWLANVAGRLNVDLLDLLPAFQAAHGNPFFEYDEHMSPLGHTVMAKALSDRLLELGQRSNVRLLSTDFTAERYPSFSQDGSLLTYQSLRDGNMELFIGGTNDGERRRLTFNDVDESHPTLSKDNSQILFTQGSPESQQTEVVIMNLDGSHRRVLTAEPHLFGAIPTFSRSNAFIVYAEWAYDSSTKTFSPSRVVVLDVLSGNRKYLTPADYESWRPVFDPAERRVYYISKRHGQFDLYSHDLVTGTERQLTYTPFDEWDPHVASDGSHVVFAARMDNNWDLFILDTDDGTTRRLTATKGDEWDPYITPDRTTILFGGRFGLRESLFAMPFPH